MRWLLAALVSTLGCGGPDAEPVRTPLSGPASSFLAIKIESSMSQSFQLVALTVTVDGTVVATRGVPIPEDLTTVEPLATPVCIHRGMVQSGTHDVAVELVFRGNGYGVFSYLRGYRFITRSNTEVTIPRQAFGVEVTATAHEGGGVTTPLEERPAIRWQTTPHARPDLGCRPEDAPMAR